MAGVLLAVVGPTASGKSDLALFLAETLGGEIVNCDSMQVYRGFDIGTAKSIAPSSMPSVPHHLFDIIEPSDLFTAGEYARRAAPVIADIASRGKTAVLVGGTGFYLRALLDGLAPAPERNVDLRERLEKRYPRRLHRLLKRLDPAAAARIHPHDKPKLIRAIEVCVATRRPMTEVLAEGRRGLTGFSVTKFVLNPPRAALYNRIDQRTVRMFQGGLVAEVRGLLDQGVSPDAKPFEAPGYTEALAMVQGKMTEAEAIESTARRTRQYAKRQLTWFRKEQGVTWLAGFGDDPDIQAQARRIATDEHR